jgi:hypothetical protein
LGGHLGQATRLSTSRQLYSSGAHQPGSVSKVLLHKRSLARLHNFGESVTITGGNKGLLPAVGWAGYYQNGVLNYGCGERKKRAGRCGSLRSPPPTFIVMVP